MFAVLYIATLDDDKARNDFRADARARGVDLSDDEWNQLTLERADEVWWLVVVQYGTRGHYGLKHFFSDACSLLCPRPRRLREP